MVAKQQPPFPRDPLVDKSGKITRSWLYFFLQVLTKTEELDDTIDDVTDIKLSLKEIAKTIEGSYNDPPLNYNKKIDELKNLIEALPDVKDYSHRVKIGGIYFTTNNVNPSVELGYGSWTKVAQGQFLIGGS